MSRSSFFRLHGCINCTIVTLILKVDSHVVVLEDKDVVKAIVEYVNRTGVEALIFGAARKDGFLRFKAKDIPGGVLKEVPDFCTVHIISKYEKITSTRPASRPAPFVHPPPHQFTNTGFANSRGRARNQEMEEIKRELQQIRAQFVELEQHTRTIIVMLSELYETIGRNHSPYSATPSSPPPPSPPPPCPVFVVIS
ncbi:uncharacterized protein LOC107774763 [Nicotiana tabacum]|uniref:RING-type E3 ubiquitin transferase n=2 Tax=Nicotiana TaxID=4085 RepID=A0A1S3YD18_TOBAC|nr:PREDICTED: uncharacterized protein LOC104246859 [Nicotiana sylvestris]XP_016449893.1 PREDICTED: uncharacterized protein LOC107774763 [Nicotiana tabacum]